MMENDRKMMKNSENDENDMKIVDIMQLAGVYAM